MIYALIYFLLGGVTVGLWMILEPDDDAGPVLIGAIALFVFVAWPAIILWMAAELAGHLILRVRKRIKRRG